MQLTPTKQTAHDEWCADILASDWVQAAMTARAELAFQAGWQAAIDSIASGS